MKSAIVLSLVAASCVSVVSCAPARNARHTSLRSAPIAGAYGTGGDAREFRRAATFAVRTESVRRGTPIRLVSLLKAERQIVAGTNYRLRLSAQRNGATTETADAVVYHDLFGHDHLASWRWRRR